LYDVAIIGGGPGGYAAALYAHNFGLSVALVERAEVGGTCLHRGCIPAKAWIHTAEVFAEVAGAAESGVITSAPTLDWERARQRKNAVVGQLHKGLLGLLKQRKVDIVAGTGRLAGAGIVGVTGATSQRLEARKVIVATGSMPRSIPGFDPDGVRLVTSDHALDWSAQPRRVAVIGAGAIGVEFAGLLAELGSEVHLFEVFDQILPGAEPEAAKLMHRLLSRKGIKITTGVAVEPPVIGPTGVTITAAGQAVEVDVVLVAVGRAPVTAGIGLEEAGVKLDRGFVVADRRTMLTDAPGVCGR
jgi:dihydrolipoamide dehydrogenase